MRLRGKVAAIRSLNLDNPLVVGKEEVVIVIGRFSSIKSFGFDPLFSASDHSLESVIVRLGSAFLADLVEAGQDCELSL